MVSVGFSRSNNKFARLPICTVPISRVAQPLARSRASPRGNPERASIPPRRAYALREFPEKHRSTDRPPANRCHATLESTHHRGASPRNAHTARSKNNPQNTYSLEQSCIRAQPAKIVLRAASPPCRPHASTDTAVNSLVNILSRDSPSNPPAMPWPWPASNRPHLQLHDLL
jgi:hypothetical protein